MGRDDIAGSLLSDVYVEGENREYSADTWPAG
jgi:hypothetical protein